MGSHRNRSKFSAPVIYKFDDYSIFYNCRFIYPKEPEHLNVYDPQASKQQQHSICVSVFVFSSASDFTQRDSSSFCSPESFLFPSPLYISLH